MSADMDRVEALMREVADTAILPRFRALDSGDIDEKSGPQDLVTVADREAEDLLAPALEGLLPGSRVVGEEGVSSGATALEHLLGDQPVWLVDPVDGTYNFVHGSEKFGVIVALALGGEVRQGWILFPSTGTCARAERGAGAYVDGERLGPPPAKPFSEAFGDYSHSYVDEPFRSAFLDATAKSGGTRQGRCSAQAYTDLARGRIDYVLQYKMTPWDHAAGQVLVEEAGGRFGFLPGGQPYSPRLTADRPMLAVARADVWDDYAGRLPF